MSGVRQLGRGAVCRRGGDGEASAAARIEAVQAVGTCLQRGAQVGRAASVSQRWYVERPSRTCASRSVTLMRPSWAYPAEQACDDRSCRRGERHGVALDGIDGVQERVVAPHDGFVDTEVLALVGDAVLEKRLLSATPSVREDDIPIWSAEEALAPVHPGVTVDHPPVTGDVQRERIGVVVAGPLTPLGYRSATRCVTTEAAGPVAASR